MNRERSSLWSSILAFRFVRCPRCTSRDLRIRQKRDRVDGFSKHPVRLLQGLFGARLYYCWQCRLQFYDIRRRARGHRVAKLQPTRLSPID